MVNIEPGAYEGFILESHRWTFSDDCIGSIDAGEEKT
jgi:hypothetical protein